MKNDDLAGLRLDTLEKRDDHEPTDSSSENKDEMQMPILAYTNSFNGTSHQLKCEDISKKQFKLLKHVKQLKIKKIKKEWLRYK